MKASILRALGLFLIIIISLLFLLGCGTPQSGTPGAPAEPIVWRATSITPPTYVPNDAPYYTRLIDRIAEESGGRIVIETHWNNELGFGHRDFPRILKEGMAEISDLPWLMGSEYIPALGFESYPLHLGPPFPDNKIDDVYDGRRKIYDEIGKEWDFKVLAAFYLVPGYKSLGEWYSTKPLRSLDDFNGVSYREFAPESAAFWANFGAKGVIMPMTEIYMALKTGMVDASVLGRGTTIDYNIAEVAKYLIVYYPGPTGLTGFGWGASLKYWNKLSPDLQKVLTNAYKELQDEVDKLSIVEGGWLGPKGKQIEEILVQQGVTIIELPAEDTAKIVAQADRTFSGWLVKADDLGKRLYKSDMNALGRPERFDMLMELGAK